MMIKPLMKCRRNKGQIAIILLFVLVLGLVIYAVVVNMGRLAQAKTAITVASATGAAHAASLVASMGEETWQTRIGGTIEDNKPKNCKVSWKAISYMVTAPFRAVVAAVIVIATGGTFVEAIIVAAMALASGVIKMVNYAISEGPAYMAFRDKALAGMATYNERFTTEAAQVAVSAAVNDFVMLEDLADSDADGRWFGGPGEAGDYVGRFSVVMSEFYKKFAGSAVSKRNYLDALAELVYPGMDGWGLADKPGPFCVKLGSNGYVGPDPYAGAVPAECDPCCVPETVPDLTGPGVIPTRPSGCENDVGTCGQRAPYSSEPDAFTYLYDDPWNHISSWREKWGVDDDNSHVRKSLIDPNYVAQGPASSDFNFADVPGHNPMSLHRGDVFPFFWIQKEKIGMDLNDEHVVPEDDYRCLWCDWDKPESECVECNMDQLGLYRGHRKYKQLLLPWNPAELNYDQTHYIPGTEDNIAGNPPLGLDVVIPYPWFLENWVKGQHRYCSQAGTWPQWWPCSVSDTQMDGPDWINYGLEDVLKRAYYFLNNAEFSADSIKDFCEKLCGTYIYGDFITDEACKQNGMLKRLKNVYEKMILLDSQLDLWLKTSYAVVGDCETAWCVPAAGTEDSCWVKPSDGERATFNYSGGEQGDVQDVVACLNWNISGKTHGDGPTGTGMLTLVSCLHSCDLTCLEMTDHPPNPDDPLAYKIQDCGTWRPGNPAYDDIAHQYDVLYQSETSHGNVFKFSDCLEHCPENCHDMPRPLVPDFEPNLTADDAAQCDDPVWVANMEETIKEAENQTAKMKLRRDLLLYEVMLAKYMRNVLAEAASKIKIFLDAGTPCSWGEPGQILTYGWRDPETNRWSIVRAESEITPDNTEGPDGKGMLPWLSSGQDWIGGGHLLPNECYELKNLEGKVKVSVIRYDQPASNASEDVEKRTVKLQSGKNLWKFFTVRPDYIFSPNDLANDTTALEHCASYEYFPGKKVEGAFMLNENTETTDECKTVVENLLKQGIQSTTCAEYGFNPDEDSALNKGMIFKFIKCQ